MQVIYLGLRNLFVTIYNHYIKFNLPYIHTLILLVVQLIVGLFK